MNFREEILAYMAPVPYAETIVGFLTLALVAALASWLTRSVLLRIVRRLVKASPMQWDDALMARGVLSRLAHVVPALVVSAGIMLVPGLSEGAVQIIQNVAQAYVVLTIALSLRNLFNALGDLYSRDVARVQSRPIKGYLQVAKIVVFVFAGISIFATLANVDFFKVLAGLGAMTAVTLLIFQDTILSFVASVQISGDGRIRVGDWIEMPSENADGDVIDMALYTITVQNWDRTITSIPTKKLISESFRNWRGMEQSGGRRIKRALLVDQSSVRFLEKDERDALRRVALIDEYLDAKRTELEEWNAKLAAAGKDPVNARRVTNLGTFRAYALAYLRAHPKVRNDMTLLVRQMDPSATGIPLEIYCFTATTAWAEYEGIQSDIFDHLLAILPEFGLRIFQSTSDASFTAALSGRDRADVAPESTGA